MRNLVALPLRMLAGALGTFEALLRTAADAVSEDDRSTNGSWIWRGAWTHSRSGRPVAEAVRRDERGEEEDSDRCRHRRGAPRGLRPKRRLQLQCPRARRLC